MEPTRVNERSTYTERVYSTPLVDVHAVERIVGGRYATGHDVTLVVNAHRLSEEQVEALVAALMGVQA